MSKRLTIWILTATGFIALSLALWQTIRHWAWLDAHHLAGIAVMDLMALGVLTSMVPYRLNSLADTMTPGEMVRDMAMRSGLVMLTFTGMGSLFLFIGYLLTIPARMERPYFFLPGLLLLLPMVLSIIDIV